jgi:hypothetical protein
MDSLAGMGAGLPRPALPCRLARERGVEAAPCPVPRVHVRPRAPAFGALPRPYCSLCTRLLGRCLAPTAPSPRLGDVLCQASLLHGTSPGRELCTRLLGRCLALTAPRPRLGDVLCQATLLHGTSPGRELCTRLLGRCLALTAPSPRLGDVLCQASFLHGTPQRMRGDSST